MNRQIKTIGIVGTGVIGCGWATRFLAHGYRVIAYDPAPDAEQRLRQFVDRAIYFSCQLSLSQVDKAYQLEFTSSLQELAEQADFIQESAPEKEDLKRQLLADISMHCGKDVIIASSSSGLLPSRIQENCQFPQRVVIGHPFNPVYLLPLVEVVAGEKTTEQTVNNTLAFYESIGMHGLHVKTEIEGYISDRLQEALWREILHMVKDGVATTQEIDDAIIYGPGLRWAMMGTCLTFHLAGGEQGMRHMLEQFGPTLELPWTHLKAPELTDTLIDRMVEGTKQQANNLSISELEDIRDNNLIAIIRALRQCNYGAGNTLAKQQEKQAAKQTFRRYQAGDIVSAPLAIYHSHVASQWIDYNQHMTDGAYMIAFAEAFDALAEYLGCGKVYRENEQKSFFTAEAHVNYYKEVKVGEPLMFSTQIIAADAKKIHLYHRMYHGRDNTLLCTSEQMLLHVDLTQSKVCPLVGQQLDALMAVTKAHQHLKKPDDCGRVIGIKAD